MGSCCSVCNEVSSEAVLSEEKPLVRNDKNSPKEKSPQQSPGRLVNSNYEI